MARRKKNRKFQRFLQIAEGMMALVATVNFGLVLFDLSYIPLRELWRQGRIPLYYTDISLGSIVTWYDPYKGIEPNPDTQRYLDALDALEDQIRNTGLRSPETPSSKKCAA